MTGEPRVDRELWNRVQQKDQRRGDTQRGIRKSRDASKYPLSCQVFDLTDRCNALMHGATVGKQAVFTCSRYVRCAGKECHYNWVDAEALLACTLDALRQMIDGLGGRAAIRSAPEKIASEDRAEGDNGGLPIIAVLESRLKPLQTDEQKMIGRMAREEDDILYAAFKAELESTRAAISATQSDLK